MKLKTGEQPHMKLFLAHHPLNVEKQDQWPQLHCFEDGRIGYPMGDSCMFYYPDKLCWIEHEYAALSDLIMAYKPEEITILTGHKAFLYLAIRFSEFES